MKPQAIAVVGAGTAGLASACLLARQGHRVTLIEQAPAPAPVGAGLLLQPSGLTVLTEMGLAGPIRERGAPIHSLFGDTPEGRTVMQVRYASLEPGLEGLGAGDGRFTTAVRVRQPAGPAAARPRQRSQGGAS